MSIPGVLFQTSRLTVKDTVDRIEAFLRQHGVTIYARIDQQAEVQQTGLHIAPLEYLLFGNPKAGGPIMAANPVAALDLPLKIIVWEDGQGNTMIAWNDPDWIMQRYSLQLAVNSPLDLEPMIAAALKD